MPRKPETIDAYLASVSPDRRAALEKLRRTIHSVVPNAVECISYSMPAFRLEGHVIAGFLATAKGCSYFPFSGTTLRALSSELTDYDKTKSALHFDPKHPLPVGLVRKLLKARIAETKEVKERKTKTKTKTKTPARSSLSPRAPRRAKPG